MPLFRLSNELIFPPPSLSLPDGLLAVGGDLRVDRLLLAYRSGIFPWYSDDDPILWWSPDPRMVFFPYEFTPARRLARTIKQGHFEVTMDIDFDRVITSCGAARGPRRTSTWITSEMRDAYNALHEAGYAHSVETWQDGKLVGGLYGVSLGAVFFGESMFSTVPNASKIALAALMAQIKRWEFSLLDSQVHNDHIASLGAREIPREEYLVRLQQALFGDTRRGSWRFDGF